MSANATATSKRGHTESDAARTQVAMATAVRPKPPIAEKPTVPTKPAYIPPPIRAKCAASTSDSKSTILEHRRLPSTGLKTILQKHLPAAVTATSSASQQSPMSPPPIRAAITKASSLSTGNGPPPLSASSPAPPPSHYVHHRGRTPSTASNDGNGDYDRTSYQLEAIKQKSLDLDRRWPAHVHDENYGVFSRSASSDDKNGGGTGGGGSRSLHQSGTPSAAYHQQYQHQRVPNKIFQQSSKQLEQILAQRIEKEAGMQRNKGGAPLRRTSVAANNSNADGGGGAATTAISADAAAAGAKPMDMAKLLNAEMKLHCKSIQEKHLIERRMPQQVYSPADGTKEPIISTSWYDPGSGVKFNKAGVANTSNSSAGEKLPGPLKNELLGHMRKGSSVSTKTIDIDDAASACVSSSKDGTLDDKTLIYRDGILISGSLDALIQHMVPTDDYMPDKSFAFAFLLSARLFVRPHQLLERICQICAAQRPLDGDCVADAAAVATTTAAATTATSAAPGAFPTHFVRLLCQWVDDFPYDFRDERVMQHVRSMSQKCIRLDVRVRRAVSGMLQQLLHQLTMLDQYEQYLNRVNSGTTVQPPSDMTNGGGGGGAAASSSTHSMGTDSNSSSSGGGPDRVVDITELCTGPMQLAHQLTHIELERLSHIGAEEFVQAFAKENLLDAAAAAAAAAGTTCGAAVPPVTSTTTTTDIKKTRNLESYVQWFNRLSYLVASEIVKYTKKKQRVRIIEYWIETARESFNIGNFNSLMAIIAGLNMSPISRLKKTWAKVPPAKFMVLEHQMDPTSNFHSYRSTLKAAMWRSAGATDERQRIVIPFFSLLVKDLYFLNEGCSNRLANGYINFEKFWQLAKQVNEFIGWKQVQCTFERNSSITWQLQTSTILTENELAWWSFECEPPDSAVEKDRYKALKAEMQASSGHQQHHHHQQQHNHQHTSGQH